jgi:hypothetical protein
MLIACRCAASFLERGSNLLNLECPLMAAVWQVLVSFSCMCRSFAIVWKACEKSRFLSLIFSAVLSHRSGPYFSRCSMNHIQNTELGFPNILGECTKAAKIIQQFMRTV